MLKIIKRKVNYIFISFWILLLASINNPLGYYHNTNIINVLRFIISLSPILVFIIGVILFFINFKKIKKINLIFLFFIIYSILQIISYFIFSDLNYGSNIFRIYWPICILSVIFFMIVTSTLNSNKNIFNIFFIILLFYLAVYSLPIIISSIAEFLANKDLITFYSSFSMSPNNSFFGIPLPRSSGVGRNLVFFYIFFLFFLISYNNKNYIYFLKNLLIIFLSFYIFHLENRSAVWFVFLFNIVIFFYLLKNYNYKYRIKVLFIILIIPYLIHTFTFIYKKNYQIFNQNIDNKQNIDSKQNSDSKKDKNINFNILEDFNYDSRIYKFSDGSGRTVLWKKSLKHIMNNLFLGYGPQADRILIAENISNIFLYSLLCGGFMASIFILLIFINIFNNILYLSVVKKIFFKEKNLIIKSSIFFIIFLLFRSLFENSFAVFGIDFMIFIICSTILYYYTNKSFYICLKKNLKSLFR